MQSIQLQDQDFECPICMSVYTDPFVTPCGHTFCYSCISKHLQTSETCPCCSGQIKKTTIYPNFILSKVSQQLHMNGATDKLSAFEVLQKALSETKSKLTSAQLKAVIDQLITYKKDVEEKEQNGNMDLLLHFLQHSREDKLAQLENIRRELAYLDNDINHIEGKHGRQPGLSPEPQSDTMKRATASNNNLAYNSDANECTMDTDDTTTAPNNNNNNDKTVQQQQQMQLQSSSFVYPLVPPLLPLSNSIIIDDDYPPTKRPRIKSQFEDLQNAYLRMRTARLGISSSMQDMSGACSSGGGGGGDGMNDAKAPEEPSPSSQQPDNDTTLDDNINNKDGATGQQQPAVGAVIDDTLQEFSRMLTALSHCSRLSLIAEIPRPSLRQSSSIISSIDYDRDGSLFATAGVSKRISIFEHATVVKDQATMVHCPVMELVTRSKLSCISWNKYLASHLASSDYEGVVTLWDINAASMVQEYEAHTKRIWSIDYCMADPTLLASGSDDCTVKLWSTRSPSSINQIVTKANVCTVKWKPGSSHELAVGSADHTVSLYDFRQISKPVAVYSGHRKAVSYVRWCNSEELVSASTDSTLRLWSTGSSSSGGGSNTNGYTGRADRVYQGHINEKNFVGLSVEGDVIACGSESHEVYVYHKHLSRPVATFAFGSGGNTATNNTANGGGGGGGGGDVNATMAGTGGATGGTAARSGGGGGGGGGGGEMNTGSSDKTFVSALCWRPRGEELLVANSLGTVRMLRLSGSTTTE